MDEAVPRIDYPPLPIVGLGGSAGGLRAMQSFFENVAKNSGTAYVVILHLSPEHESSAAEILQRSTAMPVVQVTGPVKVEADHVYVIPPGKHLSMIDGKLCLSQIERTPGRRVTVDLFFRTLADTHGPRATAIVLSGADSDGAIGLKRIKELGGLTVAQDPTQAEHSGMPLSAIATGMVDWVLRVEEMPARIATYLANGAKLKLPAEKPPEANHRERQEVEDEAALREVLTFLRMRTGHDFSYYKRATVLRRIRRRMQVNSTETLPLYLDFLRTHAGEAGALLQDLLISVTNFFRDLETFHALETIIPSLFKERRTEDQIRVWVAACATGEEAYSIAMLLLEYAGTVEAPPQIQIFATDIDAVSIAAARDGFYPDTIAADVSEERLRRFFQKENRGYRVRREVRELVLFALHDLLKDAPFSRLDLISCRNLMIYLNRKAQARAFEIFHFALRPEGRLFVGSSETADDATALFSAFDKKNRIYVRRSVQRMILPAPLGIARPEHSGHIPGTAIPKPTPIKENSAPQIPIPMFSDSLGKPWSEIHFRLIERLGPPSLLVNADYEILHLSESANHFLNFSGEPSMNLLRVVHPMLRPELRAALFQAGQTATPVDLRGIMVDFSGVSRAVDVGVRPAHDLAPGCLLVVFREREEADIGESAPGVALAVPGHAEVLQRIEEDLDMTKRQLRENIEQSEAQSEEMKASNEELQAMNEELRSASEELETGREEVQSINEELTTVNHELKLKVEELSRSNSDLQNLMASTDIATIFLDRQLCIQRFTPPAVTLFNLIATDVGRPLADLTHHLTYPEIASEAERVIERLDVAEREVRHADGRWFLARMLPYRTPDDRIAGVVLTFVDITRRRGSEERLRLMIENAHDYAIFSLDLDRKITSWNPGAERLLGFTEQEAVGQSSDLIFTPEDCANGVPQKEIDTARETGRSSDDRWHERKDGSRFFATGAMMAIRDRSGETTGYFKILRDQTEMHEALDSLEKSRAELWEALQENERARDEAEAASRAKDDFLAVLSHELRTPLTPVLMATHVLEQEQVDPQTLRETIAMIRRNVQVEAQLIDDLLDVTRIGRGKLAIVHEAVDIHEAVRHAMEVTDGDVQSKELRLSIALDAERHEVNGDSMRLQQVIWNLLRNAAKFTPVGGEIQVASRNEDGNIIISVADSGIGIDKPSLGKVFEAFVQGSPDIAKEYGGLGLGLAIAKAVAEAHEGEVTVESAGFGKGATFSVKLPLPRDENHGG